MPKRIDLDDLLGELGTITVGLRGQDFELPGELPPYALELLQRGRLEDAAAVLVGEEDAPAFASRLDRETVPALLEHVWGIDPEAPASSPSSRSTGKARRPTSKRTTG